MGKLTSHPTKSIAWKAKQYTAACPWGGLAGTEWDWHLAPPFPWAISRAAVDHHHQLLLLLLLRHSTHHIRSSLLQTVRIFTSSAGLRYLSVFSESTPNSQLASAWTSVDWPCGTCIFLDIQQERYLTYIPDTRLSSPSPSPSLYLSLSFSLSFSLSPSLIPQQG